MNGEYSEMDEFMQHQAEMEAEAQEAEGAAAEAAAAHAEEEANDEAIKKIALPEAPASVNIKLWIDGYGVMLTMRGTEANKLLTQVETVIGYAKKKGWDNTWEKAPAGSKFQTGGERAAEKMVAEKEAQEFCPHNQGWSKKTSHSQKNPDRDFKACKVCGKFLGWM